MSVSVINKTRAADFIVSGVSVKGWNIIPINGRPERSSVQYCGYHVVEEVSPPWKMDEFKFNVIGLSLVTIIGVNERMYSYILKINWDLKQHAYMKGANCHPSVFIALFNSQTQLKNFSFEIKVFVFQYQINLLCMYILFVNTNLNIKLIDSTWKPYKSWQILDQLWYLTIHEIPIRHQTVSGQNNLFSTK